MSEESSLSRSFSFRAYRKLLAYALRYRRALLLAVAGMVVYSATETGFAALMKPLLDNNFAGTEWRIHSLLVPFTIILVLLLRGIGSFVSVYYMAHVSSWVTKELRSDMFNHLLQLPTSYLNSVPNGVTISKLTFNVEKTMSVSAKTLTFLVRDTLTVVGLIGWLLYLEWKLALIFLISAPPIGWLIKLAGKRLRKVSRRIQRTMGAVTEDIQQAIQAHLAIKVFGNQGVELENFEANNERNCKERMHLTAVSALNAPVAIFLAGISFAVVVYIGMQNSLTMTLSPGTFLSFITAVLLLFRPLRNLVRLNTILQDGIAAAENVFEFLDEPIEENTASTGKFRCKGHIRFKGVSLNYSNDEQPALRNIDLEIAPGETVALVGRSGAGKTSLTQLIPRLYEPSAGVIELDGHSLAELPLADLRSQITYVPQHTVLSNTTIARNITCSIDYDSDRMVKVARKAHALEFIERMPQGFDTVLHNNASILSEGQKQRISIARALFKDAPIVIFDEATSSLDAESERQIQAATAEALKHRTAIVIAHRFLTIKDIEHIVVLEQGRISGQGTHRELIECNEAYAKLYRGHGEHDLID